MRSVFRQYVSIIFADLSLEEVLSGFKTTGVLRLIFFMVFPET